MPTAKSNPSTAPAHVVAQIRRGDLIDGNALMAWYEDHCPSWLKQVGLAPDVAALLSSLPDPSTWAHVGIVGGAA